jgi:primase-polymerase (primpol)-like protein
VTGRSKDQDLIDDLAAWMQAPDVETAQTNGHAGAKAPATDETIIQKCRGAENAAKFVDLFDHGDVNVHHDGDASVADLALVAIMAFYTQDETQLERLFSSSALGQREKWRGRADYRKRTIKRALPDPGDEVYDWSRNERGRLF